MNYAAAIRRKLLESRIRIVVLDDDPTGIQTVHGCLLVTQWQQGSLSEALSHPEPFFYLLTNTRAMTREQAAQVTRSAMEAVLEAARDRGFRLIFISRSDSTLRGHFPLEPQVMKEVLSRHGIPVFPLDFFIPAFLEAGRLTLGGIHYMKDGERLVPVAETEFARDNVFAYRHSDLRGYLEEKLGSSAFRHVNLGKDFQELPEGERDALGAKLCAGELPCYVTLDTRDYDDIYRFCTALLHWAGDFDGAVVIRSSSSLPKAIAGVEDCPLLDKAVLIGEGPSAAKPLFIVGSHVRKTSLQLGKLLACEGTAGLEIDVRRILEQDGGVYMQEVLSGIRSLQQDGLTPVVYTSRQEIRLDDADSRQALGQRVSDFLVGIASALPQRPSCLIAKGGITSHDILTKGLGVRAATVLGQILTGVPCIRTGADAAVPGLPYVIFPGNVGGEDALSEVYMKLR
ncbi:MAG: hypothetical protein IJU27_01125 [Bacteroidales bacterium]|nr:hypothetical protein [Bacteroidales bacterium]